MEPGGLWWTNVLNSALAPQRLRPDPWPEHEDPVNHTVLSLLVVTPVFSGSNHHRLEAQFVWIYLLFKQKLSVNAELCPVLPEVGKLVCPSLSAAASSLSIHLSFHLS